MTTEQPAQKPEKKVLGITLGDVTKLVIGALIALAVQWFLAKSPYLRITSTESTTFPGVKNQFGLVGTSVTNDGSKEAEDVECSFTLPDSDILDVTVVSDSGSATVKAEGKHKVRGTIGTLNAGESFRVTAMVTNPDKLPAKLDPIVRGKGVVGTTVRRSDQESVFIGTLVFFIILNVLAASFMWVRMMRLKRLPREARKWLSESPLRLFRAMINQSIIPSDLLTRIDKPDDPD
jgi:hypothetical protein